MLNGLEFTVDSNLFQLSLFCWAGEDLPFLMYYKNILFIYTRAMNNIYWHQTVTIGTYEFPRFIGAPLDSITDSPFRQLVRQFSTQELLYTEMRQVGSIAADKDGTRTVRFESSERPLNYQVAANSIDYIDAAIDRIIAAGVDIACCSRHACGVLEC